MKKTIMTVVYMMMSIVLAAPHPARHQMHRPSVRPAPHHLHHPINHYSYHTHHHSSRGHDGFYFWPGFISGIIGSTISYSQPTVIKSAPVIVQPIVRRRQLFNLFRYGLKVVMSIRFSQMAQSLESGSLDIMKYVNRKI